MNNQILEHEGLKSIYLFPEGVDTVIGERVTDKGSVSVMRCAVAGSSGTETE